jgi:hypothetical protein
MNEWNTYAGRLLWAMRRAGKTNQSELARAIGVKPQSIQYLCGPDSGAQGSTHTPALARELQVSAEWLARGAGQPTELEATRLQAESPSVAYVVSSHTHVKVSGAFKLTGNGEIEPMTLSAQEADGHVQTPALGAHVQAVRVKGNALAPYVKDGQYLLLQAASDDLAPEENIVITLVSGKMLIRELMYKRADSVVVLPVHGGQPEAIEASDIARIDAVLCVAPRRWWQAG